LADLYDYKTQGEPEQKERGYIWHTAIGLQQVDGLKPSEYLIATANKNINGDITLGVAYNVIESYYRVKPSPPTDENRTEEADKVSVRIAMLLAEKTFNLSPTEYISIHRRLFDGIFGFAGKIRDFNISKSEWVLNGESVYYTSAQTIRETLKYDFEHEKAFGYKGLSLKQISEHIAEFISGLWQIHVFGEGNTRTTAVFAIKYLRSLGFEVTNEIFAENAFYFRNALVRANYNDLKKGIHSTREYLDLFFANLLLGEKNELHSRDLKI
jgi:fido (protein-threonine AMPylation protein)